MAELMTGAIGLVLGLLARMVLPGTRMLGIILTGVIGVAGAFGAKAIGEALHWYPRGDNLALIAAALGCLVLLLVAGLLKRRSR